MGVGDRQTRRTFLAAAAAMPLAAVFAGCRRSSSEQAGPEPSPELAAPPPRVARAADARQYAGAELVYYAESVGIGAAIDRALARTFAEDTGVKVRVVPRPRDATETFAGYQRLFQA